MANYLCFTTEEANSTVKMNIGKTGCTYQTSTDGIDWSGYTLGDTITLTNIGDKVYFKGNGMQNKSQNSIFRMSGKIAASGSIMSLIDNLGESTTLTTESYQFSYCFKDCTALIQAPKLPATTLAYGCYISMFSGCASLTKAPELPATELADSCYSFMFYDCNNLSYVKVGATSWDTSCTYNWLHSVASEGTFIKPSDTEIESGELGIPVGWNVKSIEEEYASTLITLGNLSTFKKKIVSDLLSEKVDKVDGKGLSTNDFTETLKTKLVNLPEDAEANSVSCTYSQLKALRDSGNLKVGTSYKITDYSTVLNENIYSINRVGLLGDREIPISAISAGHDFDIIVEAVSECELNENALCATKDGDTYWHFDNKPETWKIKYSIDNDTDRYQWANPTSGKGIIFYMEDNRENICGYDFKNIKFYRAFKENTPTSTYPGPIAQVFKENSGDTLVSGLYGYSASDNYYFTFSSLEPILSGTTMTGEEIVDASNVTYTTVITNGVVSNTHACKTKKNFISSCYYPSSNQNHEGRTYKRYLNAITFVGSYENGHDDNHGGLEAESNIFNGTCTLSSFTGASTNNIDSYFFSNNIVGETSYTSSGYINNNNIRGFCVDNTIKEGLGHCSLSDFRYNLVGKFVTYIISDELTYSSIGDYAQQIKLNYGPRYITIPNGTSSSKFSWYNISKVRGTSSATFVFDMPNALGTHAETRYIDTTSDGKIIAYSQTKSGKVGYYKDSATDTTWQELTNTTSAVISTDSSATETNSHVKLADKATQDGNGNTISSTYLPLSGGTISNSNFANLTINRTAAGATTVVKFSNSDGDLGKLGVTGSGDTTFGNKKPFFQLGESGGNYELQTSLMGQLNWGSSVTAGVYKLCSMTYSLIHGEDVVSSFKLILYRAGSSNLGEYDVTIQVRNLNNTYIIVGTPVAVQVSGNQSYSLSYKLSSNVLSFYVYLGTAFTYTNFRLLNNTNIVHSTFAMGSSSAVTTDTDLTTLAEVSGTNGVKQSATTSGRWRSLLLGYTEKGAYNTAVTEVTNQSYIDAGLAFQPSTDTLSTGKIVLNPGSDSNYCEGVRINKASNGWALVELGGAEGTLVGTETGAWTIGRRGSDATAGFGKIGDFTIQHSTSNSAGSAGVTINSEGSLVSTGSINAKANLRVGATLAAGAATGGCNMTYNATSQCMEFTFN